MSGRLQIACHVPQDLIPPGAGGAANGRPKTPSAVVGSGSGYGPPLAPEGTPLSRLVASTLYTAAAEPTPAEAAQGWTGASGKTEYDLVCLPLTNSNWQDRWERMCTITSSATELDLNGLSTAASARDLGEDQTRREAETWRAGGGFGRGEVNVTRSGELLFATGFVSQADSAVLEEAGSLLAMAADWLELDSPVEGIRFDSELVREVPLRPLNRH